MRIVKVRYRTNREFLDAYQSDLPLGGLFCPTTTPLTAENEVVCELTIPALPNKVLIRGHVRSWRPATPRLRIRAGAIVEFSPEEKEKRDFIVDTVRGLRQPPAKRRHTRLPVELQVEYRVIGTAAPVHGGLSEISIGGALLSTGETKLELGTEVVIELQPPGAVKPLAISGKVTYHAPNGSAGLKWQYRDGGGSRRLRELIRRLRVS
jgi:Tfp pilus assembly protein PilZ